jgi:hypothetical protein
LKAEYSCKLQAASHKLQANTEIQLKAESRKPKAESLRPKANTEYSLKPKAKQMQLQA